MNNTLSVMAAELANVEDNFYKGKQCSAHAQMQSSQIWMSSLSLQITSHLVIWMKKSLRLFSGQSVYLLNQIFARTFTTNS